MFLQHHVRRSVAAIAIILVALTGCSPSDPEQPKAATNVEAQTEAGNSERASSIRSSAEKINEATILKAEPANWLSTGRTYDEQRHSPLKQINQDNVKDLGLA